MLPFGLLDNVVGGVGSGDMVREDIFGVDGFSVGDAVDDGVAIPD